MRFACQPHRHMCTIACLCRCGEASSCDQTKAQNTSRLCRIAASNLYKIKTGADQSQPLRAHGRRCPVPPSWSTVIPRHGAAFASFPAQKGRTLIQAVSDIACKQNEPKGFTARKTPFFAPSAQPNANQYCRPGTASACNTGMQSVFSSHQRRPKSAVQSAISENHARADDRNVPTPLLALG